MIIKVRFTGSFIPLRLSSSCKCCHISSGLEQFILVQESACDDVLSVFDHSGFKLEVIDHSEDYVFEDVSVIGFFDSASDFRFIEARTLIHLEGVGGQQ